MVDAKVLRRYMLKNLLKYKILNVGTNSKIFGCDDKYALLHLPIDKLFKSPEISDRDLDRHYIDIINIFNKNGYIADIYPHTFKPRGVLRTVSTPSKLDKYDVIFGFGEQIYQSCLNSGTDTLKIGMATTEVFWKSYIDTLRRVDHYNRKNDTWMPNYRTGHMKYVPWHLFDILLVRGDQHVLEDYKKEYHDVLIKQFPLYFADDSSRNDKFLSPMAWDQSKHNFLFFAGNGPLLKGLDLALESFKRLPELNLHVCGTYNSTYSDAGGGNKWFSDDITSYDNIHNHGFVELFSPKYYNIINQCGFHLYPSISDTWARALLATGWYGLIPIISKNIRPDLSVLGYELEQLRVSDIIRQCMICSQTCSAELRHKSSRIKEYSRSEFSRKKG